MPLSDNEVSLSQLTNEGKAMWELAPNDIVQVVVTYNAINVTLMQNLFHYRYAALTSKPDGDAEVQNLINDAFISGATGAHWGGLWASGATPEVAIQEVVGQKIAPLRIRPTGISVNIPGVRTGNSLPQVACWSITRRGLFANRHNIGGIRVPGLPDTDEENGVTTLAVRPNLQVIADFLATSWPDTQETNVWRPVILNRVSPSLSPEVENAVAQFTIRSQRTRIAFRGI